MIEIKSIRAVNGDGRTSRRPPAPFKILASAQVEIPELGMDLQDVHLTHSEERGVCVCMTSFYGRQAVRWRQTSPIAIAIREKMIDGYRGMGGIMPGDDPASRYRFVEAPEGYASDGDETADEHMDGVMRVLHAMEGNDHAH